MLLQAAKIFGKNLYARTAYNEHYYSNAHVSITVIICVLTFFYRSQQGTKTIVKLAMGVLSLTDTGLGQSVLLAVSRMFVMKTIPKSE